LFPTVATTGARSSRVSTCPTTRRRLDALLSSSTVQSSRATAWVSTTPRRQQQVAAKAVKTWPARRRGKRPVSAPRGLASSLPSLPSSAWRRRRCTRHRGWRSGTAVSIFVLWSSSSTTRALA
jgi:hypothetical protein